MFDMDMIMDSTVVSCDVTKDIQSDDVRKIQAYIKSHISLRQVCMPCIEKWECRAGEECYNQANPKKADHI